MGGRGERTSAFGAGMGDGGWETWSSHPPSPIPQPPAYGILCAMLNFVDMPIRVLIVFNPGAGQAGSAEQDVRAARDVWREHGWLVDLRPTTRPGDGIRIAREAAAQGYHMVVAAGGDGTINEVINGLAGSETALAGLPIGTVNVWGRGVALPLQPRAAAEALLNAQVRTIDLGRAGDR